MPLWKLSLSLNCHCLQDAQGVAYQGTAQSKMANVYFHCKSSCVVKKQADFDGRLCSIPPQIEPHLLELHRAYLRRNLGI